MHSKRNALKLILATSLLVLSAASASATFAKQDKTKTSDYRGIVNQLEVLIESSPELKQDIERVLRLQDGRSYNWNQKTLADFITFFKEWLVYNPLPWDGPHYIQPFDELANSEGGEMLFNNNIFASWFIDFLNARGQYLQTAQSLNGHVLKDWKSFPDADMKAFKPPHGQEKYTCFNDIFLRVPKEAFPIAKKNDPAVLVSPASGKIHQIYTKDLTTNFQVKRDVLNIRQALNNSPHAEKFIGGSVVDILLWFTDYHYFHSPIQGEIVEIGEYAGSYNYNFQKEDWYKALAKHKRTCYIIKTEKFGLVAMIPVGFWGVGSIITEEHVKVGTQIKKGDMLGRFGYGGSSILLVFEPEKIEFTLDQIEKDWVTVKPGTQIGVAGE